MALTWSSSAWYLSQLRGCARGDLMRIVLIGGTGKEGRGLAVRWAAAGHDVVLGSRNAERAAVVAAELSRLAGRPIVGADNDDALGHAEVAVLSVPYAAH